MKFHQYCNEGFGNIISAFCSAYSYCLNSKRNFNLFIYSDFLQKFFDYDDARVFFLPKSNFDLTRSCILNKKDLTNLNECEIKSQKNIFAINCSLVKPNFIAKEKFDYDRELFYKLLTPKKFILKKIINANASYRCKSRLGIQYRIGDKDRNLNFNKILSECNSILGSVKPEVVFFTSNRQNVKKAFNNEFSNFEIMRLERLTPLNNGGCNWKNLKSQESFESAIEDIVEFYILALCNKVETLGTPSTFGKEAKFNSEKNIFSQIIY